jgi:hypothetical protein
MAREAFPQRGQIWDHEEAHLLVTEQQGVANHAPRLGFLAALQIQGGIEPASYIIHHYVINFILCDYMPLAPAPASIESANPLFE